MRRLEYCTMRGLQNARWADVVSGSKAIPTWTPQATMMRPQHGDQAGAEESSASPSLPTRRGTSPSSVTAVLSRAVRRMRVPAACGVRARPAASDSPTFPVVSPPGIIRTRTLTRTSLRLHAIRTCYLYLYSHAYESSESCEVAVGRNVCGLRLDSGGSIAPHSNFTHELES
jgi:hypothetical protein